MKGDKYLQDSHSYQALLEKMQVFTYDLCKPNCKSLGVCCSTEYCLLAMRNAKEDGVLLTPTSHPTLPMLNPDSFKCTSPLKYRVLCVLHICERLLKNPKVFSDYLELRGLMEDAYLREKNEWKNKKD